jgi:hypothetical protein
MIIFIKMQEFTDALIEFFKSLPLWGKLVILPFILLTYWLVRLLKVNRKTQINILIILKKFINNLSRKDLQSHYLFINLELYRQKVKSLNFGDSNKDFIFKCILNNKIESTKENLLDFVEKKNLYKFDNKCLSISLIKLIDKIIEQYEGNIFNEIKSKYNDKKYSEIYELVMDSDKGFNHYHRKNIGTLYKQIDKLSYSSYLDDNYEKISMFFDMIDVAMQSALLDVEITFKGFNGDFNKLV